MYEPHPAFETFVTDVAAALTRLSGAPWTVAPADNDYWTPTGVVARPDGATLKLRLERDQTRCTVHGIYPEPDSHRHVPRGGYHEIGVAWARGAPVVAKDILRRLLPPYLATWEQVKESIRQEDARISQRDALIQRLCRALRCETREDTTRQYQRYHGEERTALRHTGALGRLDVEVGYRGVNTCTLDSFTDPAHLPELLTHIVALLSPPTLLTATAAETQDKTQCENCHAIWDDDALLELRDVWSRMEPGGVVPVGDCPTCGAFCYPLDGYSARLTRDNQHLRGALERLIEWDAFQGNHDAEVWEDARAVYQATSPAR